MRRKLNLIILNILACALALYNITVYSWIREGGREGGDVWGKKEERKGGR